jgi:hypothetical protein
LKLRIKKYSIWIFVFALLVTALIVSIGACGDKGNQTEHVEITDDENYLINAYVEIKRAGALYPERRAIADSLFARLDSTIDTLRIANTIERLNQAPERWSVIFEEIEHRYRGETGDKDSKRAGAGS